MSNNTVNCNKWRVEQKYRRRLLRSISW